MFDTLSDRLSGIFSKIGNKKLNESTIDASLREVRLALLEADVNFKVVKDFVAKVKESCLEQEREKQFTGAQQVIKIVHDELTALLGSDTTGLAIEGKKPAIIMMVGLQGSGKTTSSAKIAKILQDKQHRPYLVPADVYRPAAIEQLHTLAKQLNIPAFASNPMMKPVTLVEQAIKEAKEQDCDVILIDTAGRLHIDETLMQELKEIIAVAHPHEILFVADAMTGQDAVTVAQSFDEALNLSGIVLTKMDGDARGGAALSIRAVTGKPLKFVGLGEKITEMEAFHPERVAGRILGMGDMMTLIEKAQENFDAEESEALAKKMASAEFNFDDFRTQMSRVKKMGSLSGLLGMIPGLGGLKNKLGADGMPEKELAKTDAIINSMTFKERKDPKLLTPSRRRRIAAGAGVDVREVNQLIKNFEQIKGLMQSMMGGGKTKGKGGLGNLASMLGGGGMKGMGGKMPQMPAGMGLPPGMQMPPGMLPPGMSLEPPESAVSSKSSQRKKNNSVKRNTNILNILEIFY